MVQRSRATKRLQVVALLAMIATLMAGSSTIKAQANSRYFPETGATVQGRFLAYWQDHGGLAQFGYPLTNQFYDIPPGVGKNIGTLVQYFERAVFEYHPENQPPYNVLLTLLGTERYQEKYSSAVPEQQASTDNPYTFAQTGKTIGGRFRTFWEAHGGLSQFGYPISNELNEVSDLNGMGYTVQYFERAVFEYHHQNVGTPYEVLLTQLGTAKYKALIANMHSYSIDMISADEGWIGCEDSLMFHFLNGKWLLDTNPKGYGFGGIGDIQMLSPNEVWAKDGAIYHYKDGRWNEQSQFNGQDEVSAISMISANEGWATAWFGEGAFLHYADGIWQVTQENLQDYPYDIQMLSHDLGWAVCDGGVYEYKGGSWLLTQRLPQPHGDNRHIKMVSVNEGWITTIGEATLYHYNGSQWQAVDSPAKQGLSSIDMISSNDGWAVGAGGTIMHYAGSSWQLYPSPTRNPLLDIKMVSPNEGWAVGWNGTILHYKDGVWSQYTF